MSCIETKSRAFQELATELDLHPDNLETILHRLLNKEGKDNPTKQEILAELQPKPFNATRAELKYFIKANHGLMKYGSIAEANHQIETWRKIFDCSPTMWRTSRGTYMCSLGTPVVDGVPFILDNTLINQVLSTLNESNPRHNLLKTIIDALGDSNIRVGMGILKLEDTSMGDKKSKYGDPLAIFDPRTRQIKFDPFNLARHLDSRFSKEDIVGRQAEVRRLFTHELLHQLSYDIFHKDETDLRPEERVFRDKITSLYDEATSKIDREKYPYYGFENVDEFLSEAYSNADFQRHLARIKSGKSNLLTKFRSILSNFLSKLGFRSDSILANVMAATQDYMTYLVKEKETAEINQELQEELSDNYVAPSEDLFAPSTEGFYSLKDKLFKLDGLSEGSYSLERRSYKGEDFMTLNIPIRRGSLDESINEGKKLLRKAGLDSEDFTFGKLNQWRSGDWVKVSVKTLATRKQEAAEKRRKALEEKAERDLYDEIESAKLSSLEDFISNMTQEERDFVNRLEEVDPVLAQQVLDRLVSIDQANELFQNGDIAYAMSEPIALNPNVEEYQGFWTREEVSNNPDKLYLFGDNTRDRITTHHVPTSTQAVIRGLDNALGIDTKKNRGTSKNSFLTDEDFDTFKAQVDEVMDKAMAWIDEGKVVVLPADGIGTDKAQLNKRAPRLFQYLQDRLEELRNYRKQEEQGTQDVTKEQENTITQNESYMERESEIARQIDALNNSTILSATEVRHVAEQAVYWISDHITELQENPSLIERIYGIKIEDASLLSRADLLRQIGPDKVIEMCKQKFSPENTSYDSFETIDKAEVITDNWDAIMLLASDVFLSVENFSITKSSDGRASEVNEDIYPDADNFNDSNEQSDVEEVEGSLQEHWQVETKTLDVLATMSQLVRSALLKCYLIDKDGNKVQSEFGINERVNAREATNSILRWTQGAISLEQMIAKLQERSEDNPWVKQLIERLTDNSGKETDFQSQFFGTFSKHFQPYSVVIVENGKYKSIQVNEHPALSEAMGQVITQYKVGEHPMFTNEGINKRSFEELKAAFSELGKYKDSKFNIESEEAKKELANTLGYIYNLMGYYATPEMVEECITTENLRKIYSALDYIVDSLSKNLDNSTYEPFKFGTKDGIQGNTRRLLKPITEKLEDIAVSAFYDSGKMYQSYITPSYTSKLFKKFGLTGKDFQDFLMEEYGVTEWFKVGGNFERGWRNAWLAEMATSSAAREVFKHKVQLNFNKHNYMRNMSDMEYTLSILTEYFSESTSSSKSRVPAWFRIPMLSNKPSSEFIRFYSERGVNYEDVLTSGFKRIFDQELSRIQTVEMRGFNKKDPRFIKNFDTNGKKFMFLDFMNSYLTGNKKNSELGRLLRDKLDGKEINEGRLNELVKEVIKSTMSDRADRIVASWEAQGILREAAKITGIGTTDEAVRASLRNFVWNDTFATMNILQLTITDIAFYKDAEELQKRLAQIHAPGIRGNVRATDYEGRPVTDNKFRTIKLTDFDTFVSNIIDNVNEVFDRKIAVAKTEEERRVLRVLKESLTREEKRDEDGNIIESAGAFRQINVADAQGYSSPTSYRKKALVFGKWSRQAEEIYQKLIRGEYTYSDLAIAFQPLKPFVYSQITKDSGIEGAPLQSLKIPVQYKNSEYLLIMADAILKGENTGRPNLLRAIYEVMEESHYDENGNYKTDGIDTVQFESTVKSGLMGKINLVDLVNAEHGEAIAKARIEAAIYETATRTISEVNQETGEIEQRTISERTGAYNKAEVDVVPLEDYCLQQEVPEHFKEHDQIYGSQPRYIIVSELESTTVDGVEVTYSLEGKKVSASEFKTEYEQTLADNIQESIDELSEVLSLNGIDNIKDRNIALSKILKREILSSPRYGIDLLQACSVDENGRFRIPLGDPIQSKRVEQLINSIIKNRINKQKIAGGPVVQVSNFGTSRELNIRFKDKDGNLLKTRQEFQGTDEEFRNYIKKNQGGIAYFEVFAPIYSNQLFTQFADHDGVINIDAIEASDPELLKMIGYRIPTEDKYSMAPLKIVGFLPREAGDGIMLPNDITLLTGSDFDVDKEYLMRKDYVIKRNKGVAIRQILFDELANSQKGRLTHELRRQLHELVEDFLKDPFHKGTLVGNRSAKGYLQMTEGAYKKLLRAYMQNMYTVEAPTSGRIYRNNKIVDMIYEVLTHETSAAKMLNPGGFEQQRRMGYLISAYRTLGDKYSWDELQGMTTEKLKDLCFTDKNLAYIDTHIQFYKQNSAAGALIGIFAVSRIAHAVLESSSVDGTSKYLIHVDNACKLTRGFTVAGMDFGGVMPIDMRYDRNGQLIGKVMGSLVASAADAVKDPVLNLMNINSNTANILGSLIRLGMPFEDAAIFLSQSIVANVLAEFSRENISGYKSLDSIIKERIEKLKKDNTIDESSDVNGEELTREELIRGLRTSDDVSIVYKTLTALSNFQKIAEAMRMPTFATRFNSISSAVGPLIIDNLITEHKMQKLSSESNIVDSGRNSVDMDDIFSEHPILEKFKTAFGIAKMLFSNMPANSTGFRNLLDTLEGTRLESIIYGNRKLLSSLSDFYQSYLLIKSGVVSPSELSYMITEFPREFMSKDYKRLYPNNALIQAIKYGTNKGGRAILQVDSTGLDTQQKERLSNAWIDLHKIDPELSLKLFKYNFFRGGIGFSPKTFMNLVPVYVKERIEGYVDTYRMLPAITPEVVMDQFIRNNWDNNRLVPRKKVALRSMENGHVEVYKTSDIASMSRVEYFKIKINGEDKLFQLVSERDKAIEYKEITPLGNNKDYIEMSDNSIEKSFEKPTESLQETDQTSEVDNTVTLDLEEEVDTSVNDEKLNDLLYQILVIEGTRDKEGAIDYITKHKSLSEAEKQATERGVMKFLKARLEKLGINFDDKLIEDVYKLMC